MLRADDSSGIIGYACKRLLELHAQAAVRAQVAPAKLIDWMIKFQFRDRVDLFEIDPVGYAPALGEKGIAKYRAALAEIEADLAPDTPRHERFSLDYNAKRLAVLARDTDEIIRTHAKDNALGYTDTAKAFEEIGEYDLAIEWAQKATEIDSQYQTRRAGDYWCTLLKEHRPAEFLDAWLTVFRRFPDASAAAGMYKAAGAKWPDYSAEVLSRLAERPYDAVVFAQFTLEDIDYAWELAHSLGLDSLETWDRLAREYEKVDPLAVLEVHTRIAEADLMTAQAKNYRRAAKRLGKMRKLAANSSRAQEVDELIAELREEHRGRPRLQREFDQAGLP